MNANGILKYTQGTMQDKKSQQFMTSKNSELAAIGKTHFYG